MDYYQHLELAVSHLWCQTYDSQMKKLVNYCIKNLRIWKKYKIMLLLIMFRRTFMLNKEFINLFCLLQYVHDYKAVIVERRYNL